MTTVVRLIYVVTEANNKIDIELPPLCPEIALIWYNSLTNGLQVQFLQTCRSWSSAWQESLLTA